MEEAYSELYQQFLRLRSLCLRQAALLHQLTTALQKQQGHYTTTDILMLINMPVMISLTCLKLSADATLPNAELGDLMSISVQCSQEVPEDLQEKPEPQLATAHRPTTQCGVDGLSRNMGMFSDLLALDMSKLCVDGACQRSENLELEQNVTPLLSLDSLRWQGASSKVSKNQFQDDLPSGDRSTLTGRVCVNTGQSFTCRHRFSSLSLNFISFFLKNAMSCPLCPQTPVTDTYSPVKDLLSQSDGLLMSDVALQSHVCEFCLAVFPGDTTTRGEFLRHLYTHIT